MKNLCWALCSCFLFAGCCSIGNSGDGKVMRQAKESACDVKIAVDDSVVGDVDRWQKENMW